MKKLHIAGILVGAFLFAGCNYGATQQGTTTTGEETQTATDSSGDEAMMEKEGMTITYTDNGYVPTSVTIKAGMTVTFVNESSGGMWTASAVHPTHQGLPGFDQLKASGNGTSYSYTFQNVGEWGFHNHVAPTHFGKVVVE